MDRRQFCSAAAGTLLATPSSLAPGTRHPAPSRPTAAQLAWQDLELGMFVHFGHNTFLGEERPTRLLPAAEIVREVDAEQWARVAVAMGARYVVMVAKHHDGYCLWPTETTSYSVSRSPWREGRGDAVADLSAACARQGLGFGVYLSPRDDSQGAAGAGRCPTPAGQERYNRVYRAQLTELLTRYGPVVEVWFDGSLVVPAGDIIRRHAPGAMVFQGPDCTIRWVGNEDGFAPYPAWNSVRSADGATGTATAAHSDPEGDSWLPIEVDVPVRRPYWFWSASNHASLLSLDALLDIYYRSVGRGCQLLLNVSPDLNGRIPEADEARVRELGDELRSRFGAPSAETGGSGMQTVLRLPRETLIDHVVIQEELAGGERVREYTIEARSGGRRVTLGAGTAVGHKRIQPVPPTVCDQVRLVVTRATDTPAIRRFAVYATGKAPPETWNS